MASGNHPDNAERFICQLAEQNGGALERLREEGGAIKLRSLQTQLGQYYKSAAFIMECTYNVGLLFLMSRVVLG